MSKEILQDIIDNFNPDKFSDFFREKNRNFTRVSENLSHHNDDKFSLFVKIGSLKFDDAMMVFVHAKVNNCLTERAGKKLQYEKAKKILKEQSADAGIFIFYDSTGCFRFSLVYANYAGNKRTWNNFRRFTYYVNKQLTNKTFLKQIGDGSFFSLEKIKDAFSISAVTNIFYNEFFKIYESVVQKVQECNKGITNEIARDFVLLFAIRVIFIGFIQKKCWIGDDENFLCSFLGEYRKQKNKSNKFYARWLCPLFFEALNSAGKKVALNNNDFSKELQDVLLLAPYLNGGLFRKKDKFDNKNYYIPDSEIELFFEFLFSHSFTIEENSFEDEDLQLNPEFLGIIFERIVNKADGAVYTPRTEVDFMCRLSLVKWLEKNTAESISKENLYELFFREAGTGDEFEDFQKEGSFSKKEIEEILNLLENIAVCDPAVGSGAFIVGMLLVLDEVISNLSERIGVNNNNIFERKKKIISNSLYGVEVKEWAVWICQLRLWISLFIDAPDELKYSPVAILPSLEFKIRQGDSLVQRIGNKMFPVMGHAEIKGRLKTKITELKKLKVDYFYNKSDWDEFLIKEKEISVYSSIIDEEIEELKDQIKKKSSIQKVTKTSLFADPKDISSQEVLEYDEKAVNELREKLDELVEQKSNLRKEKPLIWNIEFAEIFVEKDGFDIVIGNPPYVSHQNISDPLFKIKDKSIYKKLLSEMIKMDFNNYIKNINHISSKSDLYIFFYLRSLRLLNSTGYHCFICSNSWLDVGYGAWFQKFLLDNVKIDFIIDNHARKTFSNAEVNTIISFMNAPSSKFSDDHIIKFVAFKKTFEELVYTENLIELEKSKTPIFSNNFRIYPIESKDLLNFGTEHKINSLMKQHLSKYIGDKWGGKYLRSPDIYFKILEKGNGKLFKLGKLAIINEGRPTGANNFFFIKKETANQYKIEERYLNNGVMQTRGMASYYLKKNMLNRYFLKVPKEKKQFENTNLEKYITYGNQYIIKKSKTLKAKKNWWYFASREPAELLSPCGYGDKIFCAINDAKAISSNSFTEIRLQKYEFQDSIWCTLNHPIGWLFLELLGRVSLGGGMLKVDPIEYRNCNIIDLRYLNNIKLIFPKRNIKSVFEECGINPKSDIPIEEQEPNPLADRAELDKVVFDALELTENERKDVYRAVCRLVWNRISKAKSV